MELFLVQHGEAKPEQEDAARPLSDRGREEVTRVAGAAARLGIEVSAVYHSGKLRAQQTAELLAARMTPESSPKQVQGLAPMDDPNVARDMLPHLGKGTMLVGHLPHLSRLVSSLVVGDPGREVVAFRNGGIVCLVQSDDGSWRVRWVLTPEMVVG